MPTSEPALSAAESRGRSIAALVHQFDELKRERDELAEQLAVLTTTFTAEEVSEHVHDLGYESVQMEWLADVITDYAWHHPDWFVNGCMTVTGAKFVRLSEAGLVFTVAGRDAIVDQYVNV